MTEQLFQIGIKALAHNEHGHILMVKIPAWKGNPGYWDLPGGRVDSGETFLQTLQRELHEEIGVGYSGTPQQVMSLTTPITIPVGTERIPLALIIYEVQLSDIDAVAIQPGNHETGFEWVSPQEAARRLAIKFSDEFCQYVAALQS